MPTYWQIAAGSDQRDYSDLFLKHGIAFTGLGAGLEKVNIGDIIVLKRGIKAIKAVGVVTGRGNVTHGDKEWLLDYDGWTLPEYCSVNWKRPNGNGLKEVDGLTRGTLKRICKEKTKGVAYDILKTGTCVPISDEPSETREVKDNEILGFLMEEGISRSSSDEITSTISNIRSLADYYYNYKYPWAGIGEHEIRTFLVVPLLLALGWSEKQTKIEFACGDRKRVDIAYFRKPCESKKKEELKKECVAIIETKSFSAGLDYAREQAKTYSKDFPNCQAVITTNGYCYKVYLRDQCDKFQEMPSAYINLLRPRDKYPLDPKVKGALEAIKWLLPNNLITIPKERAH